MEEMECILLENKMSTFRITNKTIIKTALIFCCTNKSRGLSALRHFPVVLCFPCCETKSSLKKNMKRIFFTLNNNISAK